MSRRSGRRTVHGYAEKWTKVEKEKDTVFDLNFVRR
jgi:hypothetical protein